MYEISAAFEKCVITRCSVSNIIWRNLTKNPISAFNIGRNILVKKFGKNFRIQKIVYIRESYSVYLWGNSDFQAWKRCCAMTSTSCQAERLASNRVSIPPLFLFTKNHPCEYRSRIRMHLSLRWGKSCWWRYSFFQFSRS